MAPRYDRIPEISQIPRDTDELVDAVNTIVRQLNDVFAELNLTDSQFRGNDDFTPTFNNDVDLNRFRLRNISRSQRPGDAVTRRELEEIGILGSPDGVRFNGPVTFNSNIFSQGPSGTGSGEVPTASGVQDLIESATEGLIPVARSGDPVNDADFGRVGTSQGTPAMARNQDGLFDFVQLRSGQLQIGAPELCALLELILWELRRINHAGNSD